MKGITMKKILLLILICAIAFTALTACGKCKEHVDEDKDGKCDKCDEAVEIVCTEHTDADGDKMCDVCDELLLDPTPPEVTVTVNFTLKDQDGAIIPGVKVIFSPKKGGTPVTATSDASGKLTAALVTGGYSVSYDYNSEEIGYYLPDTTSVTVEESTTELALSMTNNTPNGTASRPYIASVDGADYTVPAGRSLYFGVSRVTGAIFAKINSDAVKVTYRGEEIAAVDGVIDFAITSEDTNTLQLFTVENTTAADITVNVSLYTPLGSYDNPHVVTDLAAPFVAEGVTKEYSIYYTYTAAVSGTLTISLDSGAAYMQNMSNSIVQNAAGAATASIEVGAGQTVRIGCSGVSDAAINVTFTLTFAAAGQGSSVDTPFVDIPLD